MKNKTLSKIIKESKEGYLKIESDYQPDWDTVRSEHLKLLENSIRFAVEEALKATETEEDNDIWKWVKKELEKAYQMGRKKERVELKLEAQSIGSPDGYVKIDRLFAGTPDFDLDKLLEELKHK